MDHDRLRRVIEEEERVLQVGVPADQLAAVLALVRAQERLQWPPGGGSVPDLLTGRRLANLGGSTALRIVLESGGSAAGAGEPSSEDLDGWAERFLAACAGLVEVGIVARHLETGFMRIAERDDGVLDVWIATKRPPATWTERADVDWWAAMLMERHASELRALRAEGIERGGVDVYDRRAAAHLDRMAYQVGFPDDAVVDGCSIKTYRAVLGRLLAWALRAHDRGEAGVRSETALVESVAKALGLSQPLAGRALAAFAVDRDSAAYHSAVPGVAAAPLVRVGPDRLVWSVHGLTTEPLLFLTRELRRRAAQDYHNASHLREAVFRRDLYALFPDKRFITSAGGVELRRERGDLRTDVDAVVFDRKTGTLAVFELKSLDPFARSTAELGRQRDTILYANRQVSGVLDWLNRHGGDELLKRVDPRTAKTFRVQKVLPFVLARYLVRFGEGPEPDRRAAWGSWPQVLRLLGGSPAHAADANPLASLSTRLRGDTPAIGRFAEGAVREIVIGDTRLVVHPSYGAYRKGAAARSGSPRGG